MNKEGYIELALKTEACEIISFNDKTANVFMYMLFKMMYCVLIVLAMLIVGAFGLFFANSELLKIITKMSGYMANSVLPFSIAITTISIMHKRGKQIFFHKWLYKVYMRKLMKEKYKSGYYSKDEYEEIVKYINQYNFSVENNKLKFSEFLIFKIIKDIEQNGYLNVRKLGSYKPDNVEEHDGLIGWINQVWNKKRLITYWKQAIDKNINEYSKYNAYLFNVGYDSYFIYENDQINNEIETIKSMVHSHNGNDYVKEIELLIRQMSLSSTLSIKKDDEVRVRKKV